MDERKCCKSATEYLVKNPDYGEMIIEMIHNIDDVWILEQIYNCIVNITKEG